MHQLRKEEHLRICLEQDVQSPVLTTGLEEYSFSHCALPEMALDDTDLAVSFLGKHLSAPLMISAMTGGMATAGRINFHLAEAAQTLGLPMAVGSQRPAIEDPETSWTYQVRQSAPDVLLMANLGAVQLNYGYGIEQCQQAVDMIRADALVLHLNPLQECVQPDGNTDFSGLLAKIEGICKALDVPVVVKEVGWGISKESAGHLAEAGVAVLDVAGAGGTCWSEVERHRLDQTGPRTVASDFAEWGIPTSDAILNALHGAPDVPVIASGGIRTGIHVAKCLALGASIVGLARPLLQPALLSADAVLETLSVIVEELRIAMFCTGTRDIQSLRSTPLTRRRFPSP
jgi:isopentenyl-diphosphate delta-isomerase